MKIRAKISNERIAGKQKRNRRLYVLSLIATLLAAPGCHRPAANQREQAEGQRVDIAAGTRRTVEFLRTPPVLSAERRAQLDRGVRDQSLRTASKEATQTGTPATPPLGSEIDLGQATLTSLQQSPKPGAPTILRATKFDPATMVSFLGSSVLPEPNAVSELAEPSVAQAGKNIFFTGNYFAARSTDGGLTWSYTDPAADMPDFCCDQDVVYDRGRDLFLWYREGNSDPTTEVNRVVLGASTDGGSTWCQYTITPPLLNATWTSKRMLDYPVLSLSTNYLYITSGFRGASDTATMRLPLDALATCSSMSFLWWGQLSTWAAPVQGATSTMYFGEHRLANASTSHSMRIYQQRETESGITWKDVDIPSWQLEQGASCPLDAAGNCCPSPDGLNWCSTSDSHIRAGWVANGKIGFMWNAKQGGPFPFPYIEAATFNESSFDYVARPLVWSSLGALHYPFVSPNIRGDLGLTVFFSSTRAAPTPYFLVSDDYSSNSWQAFRLFPGARGSARWGDYVRTRAFHPAEVGWITSVYTVQAQGAEPLFYILARARDLPSVEAWWSK